MKDLVAPRIDDRRAPEFRAELEERARAWIAAWGLSPDDRDFGRALLDVAARFNSEVAERLDQAGDKMRREFLDWLAVRGEAARPARVPVVFQLAEAASQAVDAPSPVQLQADVAGASVVLETERDVRVIPGQIGVVVGVDADIDEFYLPPPGLSSLAPLEPLPAEWRPKSFVSAGSNMLQLDPEAGLAANLVVEVEGEQYRIVTAEKDLVTIDPPLVKDVTESMTVRKVTSFAPYDGSTRNRQEHVVYLGDEGLLNIDAAATIDVVGAAGLEDATWEYWGKLGNNDPIDWQTLNIDRLKIGDAGIVALQKPAGSVELKELQPNKTSRWIRARSAQAVGSRPLVSIDSLALRINYTSGYPACPAAIANGPSSPPAEGMANTTPLVLDNVFFPLGKEPRQFDTFYLGSQEAFSKKDAEAQVCFEMADPTFDSITSLRVGDQAGKFLAGVAKDGCLHLLQFDPTTGVLSHRGNREALRPPSPGASGVVIASPAIVLDRDQQYRAPVWTLGTVVYTAVSSGQSVWIWQEDSQPSAATGWHSAGKVGVVANSKTQISGLVYLPDASAGRLFALIDSTLFVRDQPASDASWGPVDTEVAGVPVKFVRIAPIRVEDNGALDDGQLSEGLVGISDEGKLYVINGLDRPVAPGSNLQGICTKLYDDVAPELVPAAVRSVRLNNRLIVVAIRNAGGVRSIRAVNCRTDFTNKKFRHVDLETSGLIGNSIDVNLVAQHLTFAICIKTLPTDAAFIAWQPFDPPAAAAALYVSRFPIQMNAPVGAPTLLSDHALVPVKAGQVLVAKFGQPHIFTPLLTGLVGSSSSDLKQDDLVAIPVATTWPTHRLATVGSEIPLGSKKLFEFDFRSIKGKVFRYPQAATEHTATIPNPAALKQIKVNIAITVDRVLLITTHIPATALYQVIAFDAGTKIATLDRPLDVTDATLPASFKFPKPAGAKLRQLLHLDPRSSGNWNAAILAQAPLLFPGAVPEAMKVDSFTATGGPPTYDKRPEHVVLKDQWTQPPPDHSGNIEFLLDINSLLDRWIAQLGDPATNPELSWEYWNGKGWARLPFECDETQNLKTTGAFRFPVPADIASSDWVGHTNFWIRARLIGGDYGKESVTVKSTTSGDVTTQTVERSTSGIRAPVVLKLSISYKSTKAVLPTYLLTKDSGTLRDQSDANRTDGAIVEAFVPLAVTLGRLASSEDAALGKEQSPADASCELEDELTDQPCSSAATTVTPPARGKAFYVGLTGPVTAGNVNLMFVLEQETEQTDIPLLNTEALVADSFVRVVSEDATRALCESGMLVLTLAVAPTRSDLFGEQLTWFRLSPSKPTESWRPNLRGAYLNGGWASTMETLTRELLGSSDGSPRQTVRVARPPLLQGTLELRVREPLGEEEIADLRNKGGETSVLSNVDSLPGDWVLWKQVVDPADQAPGDRVYALDEATGEIRFGDGAHGRIPPLGRDSIVAFRYCRTEPDPQGGDTVPGNAIVPRQALNLVSPVETVEAVFAADQAAGGAPAESGDRVVRFGLARLRHRGRAVTARDVEDLALQSSPDIVQARAFVRRGRITLLVVMRGKRPLPSAAQIRELRRLIANSTPVAWNAAESLEIRGPRVRKLQIALTLQIDTLDHAGALAGDLKRRLIAFFDTAAGGSDANGWNLGATPTEDDLALAVNDARYLESIENIELNEVTVDGEIVPWEGVIKATELVMLDDDPVRLEFATAEVSR